MAKEEEDVKTGEEPPPEPEPRPAGPTVGPGLLRIATVYFGLMFLVVQGPSYVFIPAVVHVASTLLLLLLLLLANPMERVRRCLCVCVRVLC